MHIQKSGTLRFLIIFSVAILVLFQTAFWFATFIAQRKFVSTRALTFFQPRQSSLALPKQEVTISVSKPLPDLSAAKAPVWLLFRSLRSTILQVEKSVGADLEVFHLQRDVRILKLSCISSFANEICNITARVHLRREDPHSTLFYPFESATRPLNLDSQHCKLAVSGDFSTTASESTTSSVYKVQNTSSSVGQVQLSPEADVIVQVDCHGLQSTHASRILIVLITKRPMLVKVLESWHQEASNNTLPFPNHILVTGTSDDIAAGLAILRDLFSNGTICAQVEAAADAQILCPPSLDPVQQASSVRLSIKFAEVKPCPGAGDSARSCAVSTAMEAAAGRGSAYDYLLIQGAGYAACAGTTLRLMQNVLALRRAFSLVRCGWRASCVLVHAGDALFWAEMLRRPVDVPPESVLFHYGHGLNSDARARFADAGLLVTRSPMVYEGAAGECDAALTAEASATGGHEDEGYREDSGCVPVVDELSPCLDGRKAVQELLRPQWFRRVKESSRDLRVQVGRDVRVQAISRYRVRSASVCWCRGPFVCWCRGPSVCWCCGPSVCWCRGPAVRD